MAGAGDNYKASLEMEHGQLLQDLSFDEDLEGFYSGKTTGTVNLQPQPMAFGSSVEEMSTSQSEANDSPGQSTAAAAMAGAAAAAAGAAASALMSGNISQASASMFGNIAGAAVPTSLQPVKEKAGKFMQKAQPWRDFLLPLSIPTASDGCSRITANLYCFQTNYAILFVVQLVLNVLLQPSALISIVVTAIVWVFFLKKNEDPDWKPVVGGTELGPVQRWIALAAVTAIVLLITAGSTIFNSALMYVLFAFVHGIVHDPSGKGIPGSAGETPVPL